MFIGGCGKFFEGSAEEMYPSLYNKIGSLPDDTLVWPGHEVSDDDKQTKNHSF
jgi:hydroxyacylglutathione hydrolase